MTITKEYDKFDEKFEYSTQSHVVSKFDSVYGIINGLFVYVVSDEFEIGWLILSRVGENWMWLDDSRCVLLADNLRVVHTDDVSNSEVFDGGNVFEQVVIKLESEQSLALAASTTLPEAKIHGQILTFPRELHDQIVQVMEMVASDNLS
jgi:hypothetical protein